jgi:exosortase/archaeosortase
MAIIFTMLSISSLEGRKATLTGFMSTLLASISWSIFGLTWPALATTDMFITVAYLWYAIALIFAVLTFYTGIKMLGAIFETAQKPRLTIQNNDNPEED